jgi:hypothetical protein
LILSCESGSPFPRRLHSQNRKAGVCRPFSSLIFSAYAGILSLKFFTESALSPSANGAPDALQSGGGESKACPERSRRGSAVAPRDLCDDLPTHRARWSTAASRRSP